MPVPFATTLRELNLQIRSSVLDVESLSDPAFGFFCECGARGCSTFVSLLPAEFDELIDAGRPVLADGHGVEGHDAPVTLRW